jgi:hypothetical protein
MLDMESDIDVVMNDFGSQVVFNGQTCRGIFDQPQKEALLHGITGSVSVTDFSLTYRTTSLNPSPTAKDTITVDGTSYIVRETTGLDDGKMTKLMLKTK